MSKKDRSAPQAAAEEVHVQLKPILGLRPGQYLSVLYGIVALLAIYLVLFSPGVAHHGAYLSVTTFPDHAMVKVDGQYAGSTPCTIFLRSGSRSVEISRPWYAPVTFTRNVRGRVFATLIVPDRSSRFVPLQLADIDGLVKAALADYQKNTEIPQILSEAAWAAVAPDVQDRLYGMIFASLAGVSDETQLREALLASARVSSHGGFLTPSAIVDMVQRGVQMTQAADNAPAWLLLATSRANQGRLGSSPWIQQYLTSYREAISKYYQPGSAAAGPRGGVTVAGMSFRGIPSGDLVMGKDDNLDSLGKSFDRLLAHPVRVEAFYLGADEVTNGQFQSFISENPDWAPANRAVLVQKGLVSDTYLTSWTGGAPPAGTFNLPVTQVSWHAAASYCQWLTRRVQAALPGYAARLPYESEWEWAARGGLRGMPYPLGGKPGGAVFYSPGITGPKPAGTSEPNGYGLRDMLGNVWEWCADPFGLNAGLLSSREPMTSAALERALPDAPDHAVRGGSWADQPGTDKVYTRGAQPSGWCTPYLGFRVALAQK
jgi:gamma-glutamyl hercynylcysteine S-oxide synthase